ncbi:MAG: alpha/beta hydrolase-fold protein [Thermogutta sp.]
MLNQTTCSFRRCLRVGYAFFVLIGVALQTPAEEVVLRDGRILKGKIGIVSGLVDVPRLTDPEGGGPIPLILFVDDDLRRTFISKRQIREVRPGSAPEIVERFRLPQPVAEQGTAIASVGLPTRITPFDEFGRRIFSMMTTHGKLDVIQGITELTPQFTRIQGISHVWDMRVATTSLPKDTLSKILLRAAGGTADVETRKRIARFLIQMGRYEDALRELEAILQSPDLPDNQKSDLEQSLRALKQLSARRVLEELRMRQKAGQYQTVYTLLQKFPTEGIAGEILQEVKEILAEYEQKHTAAEELLKKLDALIQTIDETVTRQLCMEILREIAGDLTPDTLPRLAAFAQLVDDSSLQPEERVALAISGWFLGADSALRRLPVALSLYRVRNLIVDYLNEEQVLKQQEILDRLRSEEGATARYAAGIIAHMRPPKDPLAESPRGTGFFELNVTWDSKEPAARYLVQLPPEYHPLRKYPTIFTFHGLQTTPEQQIDWWAGEVNEAGNRLGQAGRHGYIVIAPQWTQDQQVAYQYSAREHGVVLAVLRDALQRFSIDTDKIFLTGHFSGGDAAWDIGLAHPSLWAGVIIIAGRSDKYCTYYWENAAHVPFYIVQGELDGAVMPNNARDLDRCLNQGFNVTVAEYMGRGRDAFSDEILRLFEWMSYQQRNPAPVEFTARSMRAFDNFFWYLEIHDLPSSVITPPATWPPRNPTPLLVRGRIPSENTLLLQVGSARAVVGLGPEFVDFNKRLSVTVNGQRIDTRDLQPDIQTLLEDVRKRGDRQHPFWATIETATGRVWGRRP